MWFKLAPGQSGVLLGYQTSPLPTQSTAGWVPALYVGSDGKLRGQLWNGGGNPITSALPVNDNAWHHVVLAASTTSQDLYLDGAKVGTRDRQHRRLRCGLRPGRCRSVGRAGPAPPGRRELLARPDRRGLVLPQPSCPAQVHAQFSARSERAAAAWPARQTVTDPANNQVKYCTDMIGRKIAEIDALRQQDPVRLRRQGVPAHGHRPQRQRDHDEPGRAGQHRQSSKTCQKFSGPELFDGVLHVLPRRHHDQPESRPASTTSC